MKSRAMVLLLLLFALAAAAQKPADKAAKPAEKKPIGSFGNGAAVVAYSDQYNPHLYSAMNIIDGGEWMWSSEDKAPFPHSFTIELPRAYRLDANALDTTGVQENGYR